MYLQLEPISQELDVVQLGDKIIVTDPFYSDDYGNLALNIKPGKYICKKRKYLQPKEGSLQPDIFIADLYLYHEGYDIPATELMDNHIMVDSSCCGVFNDSYFSEIHNAESWKEEIKKAIVMEKENPHYRSFKDSEYSYKMETESDIEIQGYTRARALYAKDTNRSLKVFKIPTAGVIDNQGVVSSSGFGDGSYYCLVGRENDEIVSIRISFIPEKEELDKWD